MIPDSLFSPPQSLCFVLFKVLVSSCSESRSLPVQSPVFLPPQSHVPVLFIPLRPLSSSRSPLPILPDSSSHPPRFPFPSYLSSSILSVLSPPLPLSQRKQRNDTKPSRRSWWWFVPKWNMILSLRVRPQSAVARLEHLKAVVPISQLLPGLVTNVLVHADVKHAMIARPAAHEREVLVFHCASSYFYGDANFRRLFVRPLYFRK